MANCRIKYDKDATELENKRRTKPSIYMLTEGLNESKSLCAPEKGTRHSVTEMSRGNRVQRAVIESQLRNSHIPLNENNKNNEDWKKNKLDSYNGCDNFNNTNDEYSRLSHPLCDFRGLSTLNHQIEPYLPIDPQSSAMNDDFLRKGFSTRIGVKDSHTLNKPELIDQSSILPKPTNEEPKLPTVGCK